MLEKNILVGIPLSTSITLCFSASESGLKAAFQFQLVPLLRHLSSNELTEINTPAGYCSIYDRKQRKITPRKVQEKNGIICPHKKLLLDTGFLRLLYTPKLLEFYPSKNMKEIIKARASNYPFFFFSTIILFKT